MDWNEQVHPNVEDIVAYLDLLEKQPRQRIVRGCVGGCTVWVKRYDTRRRPVGKLLHEAISPLLTSAVLKASPHVDADGLAKREERKIEAFRAAGFHTPKVLFRKGPVLVLSHEGGSLEGLLNELRRSNAVAHDRLLIKSAEVLAQLHDAGLCHGRPHKRDLLVKDGTWVFLDFEEEPEAVMPLSAAQARDVWLFFFQITHAAIDPDTAKLAFAPYRRAAPDSILDDLAEIVGQFRPVMPVVRLILRVRPGGDLGRLRKVMDLLSAELAKSAPPQTKAD